MQHTIHLEGKAGYLPRPCPALRSECIVGCIFHSVGFIITRESPCILFGDQIIKQKFSNICYLYIFNLITPGQEIRFTFYGEHCSQEERKL
jgi:hypothetical protein